MSQPTRRHIFPCVKLLHHRAGHTPFLLVVLVSLTPILPTASAQPNLRDLRNLGISGQISAIEEPWLVVRRYEDNDGVDLNGDGDRQDYVIHVYDLRSDQPPVNVGLHGRVVVIDPPLLVLRVSEFSQGGTDFTGDGDTNDEVVFYYNLEDGAISMATGAAPVVRTWGKLLVILSHESQAIGDLNGDGDHEDRNVLHVERVGGRFPLSLGIVANGLRGSEQLLAFGVSEKDQGLTDLNGDGDLDDKILHVFDVRDRQIVNLGFVTGAGGGITCPGSVEVAGPVLYIPTHEGLDGEDFNGDGDRDDNVPFVYDARTDSLTNLGLSTVSCNSPRRQVIGELVCFAVSEFDQGFTDLNGDGDIFDEVIHTYDASTGELINLGLAGQAGGEGELFVIEVDELGQGLTDLNGDGDFLDYVQHILDPETGEVTNLRLAAKLDYPGFERTHGVGRRFVFRVDEQDQGFTDLNANGIVHSEDDTLFVYDGETGRVVNLGIVDRSQEHQWPIFQVVEGRQSADLNRDGDRNDLVYHLYDDRSGILVNLGLHRGEMHRFRSSENVIGFCFYERVLNQDLNGDGDTEDDVIHISLTDGPYGKGTVNRGQGPITDVLRINGLTGTVTVPPRSPVEVSLDAAPLGPAGRYILWGWAGISVRETDLQVNGISLGHTVNPTAAAPLQRPRPFLCFTSPGIPPLPCRGTVISMEGPPSAPFRLRRPAGAPETITLTLQAAIEDLGAANPVGWSVTNAVTLQVRGR